MEILAKSKDKKTGAPGISLKTHVEDCLLIFRFLITAFPKVADTSGKGKEFWQLLKSAIICHDLGKTHKEFQNVLNGRPDQWHSQRHELFSLPFIDALVDFDKKNLYLIKLAVAGHHKDFETLQNELARYETEDNFGLLPNLESKKNFTEVFTENIQVDSALQLLKGFTVNTNTIHAKDLSGLIRLYNKAPIKPADENYLPLMFLFGGLKWCDHLGSARITELKVLENSDFDFLKKQEDNLNEKGLNFYQHQLDCRYKIGNLILTAPTGSGKTESALLWLQSQIKFSGQGRVFYILPFTASINAMYERLNAAMGKEKVGMLHGKLNDYFNNYFDDLQYNVSVKKDSIQNIREKFKSIVTPLKVTTPFQLLKHLFGLKGYEQGIFEMAGSYLIFDEIHAYSPETFAQIKVLLEFATKHLQSKVMIMTATMPRFMQYELEQGIGSFQVVKANTSLYDKFRRHQVILTDGLLQNNLAEITIQLKAGKKVLVVCNTVKASQDVFKKISKEVEEGNAVLLHGSFSGADRAKKEKNLKEENIQLLVGTQAIEVSLDIDYDMIYTEPAPIDALIQRFGRVNRRREKGICPCFVFTDNNESDLYIYEHETIKRTLTALKKIEATGGIIDEAILQNSIDEVYPAWDESDRKKFADQFNYLMDALLHLSPMFKHKHTEDDFYKQFDGIKILPQSNKAAYEKYLTGFDFINAESQKVQIRKNRFMGWLKNDSLKRDISVFAKKNKMEEQHYWLTNKKYCPELGLLADEEEQWQTTELL